MSKLIVVLMGVGLVVAGGLWFVANTALIAIPTEPVMSKAPLPSAPVELVGNDRDEHGCIGSAGYSWCEGKQKCLRVWEEVCEDLIDQEIQQFLAKKYNTRMSEVTVTVSKQDGNYATGGVKFGVGGVGEGGLWLAQKTGTAWEVVWDGNGMVDCTEFKKEYTFPQSVLANFCD